MKQLKLINGNLSTKVDDSKYYGVCNAERSKGFIARAGFHVGDFKAHSVRSLTAGNGWSNYCAPHLTELFRTMLSQGGMRAYEFQTAKELFAWLAK